MRINKLLKKTLRIGLGVLAFIVSDEIRTQDQQEHLKRLNFAKF